MSEKFTPGPWAVLHGGLAGDDGWSIGSKMKPEFGVVAESWKVSVDGIRDEVLANARLIAAAPELLAACKAAKELKRLHGLLAARIFAGPKPDGGYPEEYRIAEIEAQLTAAINLAEPT